MWWLVGHGLRAAVRWRGFAKYSELRRGRRVRDPRGLSTGRTLLVLAGRASCPRLGSWQQGVAGTHACRPRHQTWVRAQAGNVPAAAQPRSVPATARVPALGRSYTWKNVHPFLWSSWCYRITYHHEWDQGGLIAPLIAHKIVPFLHLLCKGKAMCRPFPIVHRTRARLAQPVAGAAARAR